MIRRLLRAISCWNHRQHVKDLDYAIAYYERMVLRLPAEIQSLNELRRYHIGRASTLAAPTSRVNYTLGRSRKA